MQRLVEGGMGLEFPPSFALQPRCHCFCIRWNDSMETKGSELYIAPLMTSPSSSGSASQLLSLVRQCSIWQRCTPHVCFLVAANFVLAWVFCSPHQCSDIHTISPEPQVDLQFSTYSSSPKYYQSLWRVFLTVCTGHVFS